MANIVVTVAGSSGVCRCYNHYFMFFFSFLIFQEQAAIPVVVEIRDMGGAKTGLFNTATATINLVDINDNVPTFREAAVHLALYSYKKTKSKVIPVSVSVETLQSTENREQERVQYLVVRLDISRSGELCSEVHG